MLAYWGGLDVYCILIKSFIDDKLGVACNLIVEREYGLYDLLL